MKKKKKEEFYYKNLSASVEYSYQAAQFLRETLTHFHRGSMEAQLAQMHDIEQKADAKRHKMMAALGQEFITPIEREDLVSLSSCLDDITDAVEEILLQIYLSHIPSIRGDVFPMLELLLECIQALQQVLEELKHFRHSKKIEGYIIRVNDLEERGDTLYRESMYRLHEETDVRTILNWRGIYECIENCMDTCEHAADIVDMVIMKNS